MRIASFDIGKKNFAFYIEEFDEKAIESLKSITNGYNEDGTITEEMKELLDQIYMNGKTILHKNVDITQNCDKKAYLDPETYYNMKDVLESHIKDFETCSVFLIEQQMQFGRFKNNTMAQKLGQHCYSYFVYKFGREKEVVEFPAYHKTQVLGAPKIPGKPYKNGRERWKSMTKPNRKKWSVSKAKEILEKRGEIDVLKELTTVKKKDDLADTLTQLQAYKYLTFVK